MSQEDEEPYAEELVERPEYYHNYFRGETVKAEGQVHWAKMLKYAKADCPIKANVRKRYFLAAGKEGYLFLVEFKTPIPRVLLGSHQSSGQLSEVLVKVYNEDTVQEETEKGHRHVDKQTALANAKGLDFIPATYFVAGFPGHYGFCMHYIPHAEPITVLSFSPTIRLTEDQKINICQQILHKAYLCCWAGGVGNDHLSENILLERTSASAFKVWLIDLGSHFADTHNGAFRPGNAKWAYTDIINVLSECQEVLDAPASVVQEPSLLFTKYWKHMGALFDAIRATERAGDRNDHIDGFRWIFNQQAQEFTGTAIGVFAQRVLWSNAHGRQAHHPGEEDVRKELHPYHHFMEHL